MKSSVGSRGALRVCPCSGGPVLAQPYRGIMEEGTFALGMIRRWERLRREERQQRLRIAGAMALIVGVVAAASPGELAPGAIGHAQSTTALAQSTLSTTGVVTETLEANYEDKFGVPIVGAFGIGEYGYDPPRAPYIIKIFH